METPKVDGFSDLELIGTSGSGQVYLALDDSGAEVAVKVFDQATINRVLWKRFALRLERGGWPVGVLPVLAADLDQAPGIRVTPAIIARRENDTPVPRSLQHQLDDHPGPETWRLVTGLARALAAMHARGVPHGNLKPGNVLLDGDGRVLLTDWALGNMPGIGKFAFTDAVLYQPPEQLREPAVIGGSGAFRVDVFAFGVLAYRMLTGVFPRCQETFAYVAPPSGETRRGGLAADLRKVARSLESQPDVPWPDGPHNLLETGYREWIGRCLALDPRGRPLAMTEVAAGFEAVERAEADRVERELTVSRRHRAEVGLRWAVFASGAAIMLAVVIGSLWHLSQTRLRGQRAAAFDDAATQRALAESALGRQADLEEVAEQARRELEYEKELWRARLEASRQIGDQLFAWAMEKGHRSLPPLDGRELRLKRLERYYVDFLTRTASIRGLDVERARARIHLAEISLAAGDEPAATRRLEEALAAWTDKPMDAEWRLRMARNSLLLALLRQSRSDPETEAAFVAARDAFAVVPRAGLDTERLDQLLAILDFHEASLLAARGDDTRALEQLMRATQTLNRIADQRSDSVILRSELAACYLSSATILEGIGSLGDAREVRALARDQLVQLLAANPTDPQLRLDLAGCHGAMAEAALLSGDVTGATALIEEALALLDRLLVEQPDHVEAASRKAAQLGLRAGIRRDRGFAAEAMEDFEEGIRLLERLRVSAPEDALATFRLAHLWWQMGRMLGVAGERDQEIALISKARAAFAGLEANPRTTGPQPHQIQIASAYALGDLGHALQLAGRGKDAVEVFKEAVILWESLLNSRPTSEEYIESLAWCRQRLEDLK